MYVNALIVLFVLFSAVFLIPILIIISILRRRRKREKALIQSINSLAVEGADLRNEIFERERQLAALPKPATTYLLDQPLHPTLVRCFFCDEAIPRAALVCSYCRRANVHNEEAVAQHEIDLTRMLVRK